MLNKLNLNNNSILLILDNSKGKCNQTYGLNAVKIMTASLLFYHYMLLNEKGDTIHIEEVSPNNLN